MAPVDRSARALVVTAGARVRADGSLVRTAAGDLLDVGAVDGLVGPPPAAPSATVVRVTGIDPAAFPPGPRPDGSRPANRVQVIGTWDGAGIAATAWSAVEGGEPAEPGLPPAASALARALARAGLDDLRASGTIVCDRWVEHEPGVPVFCIAATDVAAVEAGLGPRLSRQVRLVASPYTVEDLRLAQEELGRRAAGGCGSCWVGMDASCRPTVHAAVVRVDAQLADWADSLPTGLLTLTPAIVPASP